MAEPDESSLATAAVARLRTAGYHVDCDADFDTDSRPASYLPVGASVDDVAERIREATTTDEAAEALTELTAAHDGVLAALENILTAAAEFHDGLNTAVAPTSLNACATSPTYTFASSAPSSPRPAPSSPTGTPRTPAAAPAPK
ncbi:hypothetical protein [Streptomyces sp. NBC_00102]|uniref:hypothetical protein n=1 Tax=Streptomyces sp. NBC_00102 TaxID=2975652 RepID=UPI00224EB8CC|nr:hypothetical protein [Streptomyces sp. NBC_00102]MCX5395640.1 hypothetical protein [Streptomyces sp. NBC_00102]